MCIGAKCWTRPEHGSKSICLKANSRSKAAKPLSNAMPSGSMPCSTISITESSASSLPSSDRYGRTCRAQWPGYSGYTRSYRRMARTSATFVDRRRSHAARRLFRPASKRRSILWHGRSQHAPDRSGHQGRQPFPMREAEPGSQTRVPPPAPLPCLANRARPATPVAGPRSSRPRLVAGRPFFVAGGARSCARCA